MRVWKLFTVSAGSGVVEIVPVRRLSHKDERTSFCTTLCDSAGCKSVSCCSLCRCQLGCLCCSLGFSLDILSDLVSGELGTGFSVSVAGTSPATHLAEEREVELQASLL